LSLHPSSGRGPVGPETSRWRRVPRQRPRPASRRRASFRMHPTPPIATPSGSRGSTTSGRSHVAPPSVDVQTSPLNAAASALSVNERSFLVELPLRRDPPTGWEAVFKAEEEAKRNLALGGDDAWKGCVAAVRTALEEWRNLEKEDQGPGWTAPTPMDRSARTKAQRADALRWHLLQCSPTSPITRHPTIGNGTTRSSPSPP
jgi:hypothetical protein